MSEEITGYDDEIPQARKIESPGGTGIIRLPYRLPDGTTSRGYGRSTVRFQQDYLTAKQILQAFFSGQPPNGLGLEGPGPQEATPGTMQSQSPTDFQQSSPVE